jgi:hypothetical protein
MNGVLVSRRASLLHELSPCMSRLREMIVWPKASGPLPSGAKSPGFTKQTGAICGEFTEREMRALLALSINRTKQGNEFGLFRSSGQFGS